MVRKFTEFDAQRIPSASLVFFAGESLTSRLIALRTCYWRQLLFRRWISHVAIVFRHQRQQKLAESTTLNTEPCCIRNVPVKGVQAHYIADRINNYNGKVWIAKFQGSLTTEDQEILCEKVLEKLGTPYDTVGALVTGGLFIKKAWHFDPGHWFCSEVATWWLRQVNLNPIDLHTVEGLITPAVMALQAPRHHLHKWSRLRRVR